MVDGRGHVHGVERAGDRQRDQPGPRGRVGREGGELLQRAAGHDLPGAVDVGGGEAVPVDGGEHVFLDAAEDRGHAGLGDRGGLGHRLAALADEDERLLGGEHAGQGGGGELADAVSGDAGPGSHAEHLGDGQRGGDQQGLRDGGVADLVRVGGGPVGDQIEAGAARTTRTGGPPDPGVSSHGFRNPGVWAPWPGATMTSTKSNTAL